MTETSPVRPLSATTPTASSPVTTLERDLLRAMSPDQAPHRALLEEFGLTFEPVRADQLAALRRACNDMGSALGGFDLSGQIAWPQHGFIQRPLTGPELHRFDEVMGPNVAPLILAFQEGLRTITYVENGERTVDLRAALTDAGARFTVSSKPFHEACGPWAGKERIHFVRESVAASVIGMIGLLNAAGYLGQLEDGYRPPEVQFGLLMRRIDWIRNEHPGWNDEQVLAEAATKTACAPFLAGHMGAAAVDITMRTLDGEAVDNGATYPQGGVGVIMNFPYLTFEQFMARELFRLSAVYSGLSYYPGETWHLSKGDGLAAACRGSTSASFTPVTAIDRDTGTITPLDPALLMVPFSIPPRPRA